MNYKAPGAPSPATLRGLYFTECKRIDVIDDDVQCTLITPYAGNDVAEALRFAKLYEQLGWSVLVNLFDGGDSIYRSPSW